VKKSILSIMVMLGPVALDPASMANANPVNPGVLMGAVDQSSGRQQVDYRGYGRHARSQPRRSVYGYRRAARRRVTDPDLRWGQWLAWHRNWY